MSETTNLKLFKHDNVSTNANAFDVDKALNKNWDKIEEFAEDVDSKVKDIDLSIKTNTNEIESLKTKHAQEISALENLFPTGQASGENITINDASNYKFKDFKISGNSWQATRSGKNILMEKRTQMQNQITWWFDNNLITNTMYFSVITSISLQSTNRLYIGYWETASSAIKTINLGYKSYNANEKTVITIDLTDEQVSALKSSYQALIQIYDVNAELDYTTITFDEVMLSSSNDTSYEAYGVMPSSPFPSPIRNCGDNVNLLDLSTEILFYGNLNSDNKSITCNINNNYYSLIRTAALNEYLMKHKGETITFSTGTPIKGKTTSIVILGNMTTGANYYEINEENTGKCSITIPKEFSNITNLELRFNRQMTPFTDTTTQIKYLKLEKGSKATPYSPYNCGNVNLKVQNKNFLNVPQNYVLTGNEIIDLNLEAGNYIINWEDIVTQGTSTNMLMMFYYEDETTYARYISPTYGSKSLQLNATKNITKVRIYSQDGYNSSQNVTTTFKNLMISKNGGDYVSHEEQTVTFPLEEGQVLHEEDYLADDGIHHKRGQSVVNSDTMTTVPNGNKALIYYPPNKTNKFNNILISSNAIFDKQQQFKSGTVYENLLNVVFVGTQEDTLESLQVKYNGGILEYELAEEEIEPYTEAQKVAYEKIKALYSYEDVTHISSDDEIKPKYEVTYLRDLQKLFNNMTV